MWTDLRWINHFTFDESSNFPPHITKTKKKWLQKMKLTLMKRKSISEMLSRLQTSLELILVSSMIRSVCCMVPWVLMLLNNARVEIKTIQIKKIYNTTSKQISWMIFFFLLNWDPHDAAPSIFQPFPLRCFQLSLGPFETINF